jgi:hypothetical protein
MKCARGARDTWPECLECVEALGDIRDRLLG